MSIKLRLSQGLSNVRAFGPHQVIIRTERLNLARDQTKKTAGETGRGPVEICQADREAKLSLDQPYHREVFYRAQMLHTEVEARDIGLIKTSSPEEKRWGWSKWSAAIGLSGPGLERCGESTDQREPDSTVTDQCGWFKRSFS
ncbi:hypothetical protein RRG08_032150 [Elysia crispata]|uniref:Uncharacterized protein n=1 Tax=Elysia crispata TaxID=231223 RepID=A0AAE1DVP0_9GAST|nr:hypothetical protein RRG08_032150 [Elysia crispata]